jgi:D-tyrosyl-tRNA(Tyr) deacylase
MKIVIQRVKEASVSIAGKEYASIQTGLLVFLGITNEDNQTDIDWLVHKIINLRIFNDDKGVMNLSLQQIKGELLVVSQFTLHASTKKGHRPSYIEAARPEVAIPLYKSFLAALEQAMPERTAAGQFGADMKVRLINDGPVTIIIDSKNRK